MFPPENISKALSQINEYILCSEGTAAVIDASEGIPMKIYGIHNGIIPCSFASFRKVLNVRGERLSADANILPSNTPLLKNIRIAIRIMPISVRITKGLLSSKKAKPVFSCVLFVTVGLPFVTGVLVFAI